MEWLVPRRSPWPISRGNVCLPLFARRHMGRRYKWRGCLRKQKKPLQRKAWWFLHGLLVLLITGQMSKRLSFSEMVCAKSGKRIRWLDLNVSSLRSKPNYWEILKLVILQEIWGWFWSVTLGSVYPRRIQRLYTSLTYSRTRRWRKFQKGKIYNAEEHVAIESFVTTLIHWTFFSDDANKVGICWLCRSGQLHVTPSSRWSLPRCHRSVRNDMRLFLRTKQYPVQLRTTKYYSRRYYSSTTKY